MPICIYDTVMRGDRRSRPPIAGLVRVVWFMIAGAALGAAEPDWLMAGSFSTLGRPNPVILDTASAQPPAAVAVDGTLTAMVHLGSDVVVAGRRLTSAGQSIGSLARIRSDGTVVWSREVEGDVSVMVRLDQTLAVGGHFSAIGGEGRLHAAMIYAEDGTVLPWRADTPGTVYAFAFAQDAVYMGGNFQQVNGTFAVHLARLDPSSGQVDAGYSPEPDGEIRSLAVLDDHLYAAGLFSRFREVNRSGVARLALTDGSVDRGWRCDSDGPVFSMAISRNRMFLGGVFTTLNGANRSFLAQVRADSGSLLPWEPQPNDAVTCIAEAGQNVAVGGRFTSIAGSSVAGLGLLDRETGAIQPGWRPAIHGPVTAVSATPQQVWSAGSCLIIGERYSSLVRLKAGNPIPGGDAPSGGRGLVFAVAADRDHIYLGGDFQTVGGRPRLNLARLDRATQRLDLSWRIDAQGVVRTVLPTAEGVWIGGDFTSIGGQSRSMIAMVGKDGAVRPLNLRIDGPVRSMLMIGQGVLIAGEFTSIDGVPRNGLARITADGRLDAAWVMDLAGHQPAAERLLEIGGNRVIVAGRFDGIGGSSTANLACIDPQRAVVVPDQVPVVDGPVHAVAIDGGLLALGGDFATVAGQPRPFLALWSASGRAVPSLPVVDGPVFALALDGQDLLAGGDFAHVGGSIHPGLIRLSLTDGQSRAGVAVDGHVEMLYRLP